MPDSSPSTPARSPTWTHLASAVIAAFGLGAGGGAAGIQFTAGDISGQLTAIVARLDTVQATLTQVLTYEARIARLETELRAHVEREGHAEVLARLGALERENRQD